MSAATLLGVAARHLAVPSRTPRAAAPWYNPGDRIGSIPGLELDARKSSVLLLLHPACPHCTRGMPFYRRLLTYRANRAPAVRIVVVSRAPLLDLERYLADHALRPDVVASIAAESDFRLVLTPAIVSVKPGNLVSRIWTGALTTENERAVLEEIDALALPSRKH